MSLQQKLISQFPEDQYGGILIMDSGFGSLSFLPTLNQFLPNVPLTAFADHEFFPYGEKSEEQIVNRLLTMTDKMVGLTRPATILIACNTASTVVLPSLREKFDIPIVGIVPAIKPAAQVSRTGKIALLATPGTVSRPYIDDLINEYAADCCVIKVGCPALAGIAEDKLLGNSRKIKHIRNELESLLNHPLYHEVDTLILGCTHFTFVKDEISQITGAGVTLLDPIDSVSRQVVRVNKCTRNTDSKNTLIISSGKYSYENFDFSVCSINGIFFL